MPDVCETGSGPGLRHTLQSQSPSQGPPPLLPPPNLALPGRLQTRSFQLGSSFSHPSPWSGQPTHSQRPWGLRALLFPPFSCGPPNPALSASTLSSLTNTNLLPLLPRSPPSPLPPHWSQPTLCHLRTPRDSRNGLNSVGRSPGIRHEVTSRPLSGLPALPSAGLLSACQTGSSVGPRSLWGDGKVPDYSLPCPSCRACLEAQGSPCSPLPELGERSLVHLSCYMVFA